MELNHNRIEELGFIVEKKGLFPKWQVLTIQLRKDNKISLNEAAEMAFRKLI